MIKIKPPRELTKEEQYRISENWFKPLEGVCFQDWNDTLRKASYPINFHRLPKEKIRPMIDLMYDSKGDIETIMELVSPHFDIPNYDNGFFIKLISRSPKDWSDKLQFFNLKDAMQAVLNSMRCFDDLVMLSRLDCDNFITRPFIDIEKWREFRVLVFDGKIQGISQYFYDETFSIISQHAVIIEQSIRRFIDEIVTPNMKVKSFCADIVWPSSAFSSSENIILLETNPYGLSDPCIFKSYENLDGTFKYNI